MSRIHKSSMRNPSCTTIIQRIIALDKQRLIRPLSILEIPTMIWIWLDSVRLARAVRIDQRSGNKVAVRNGMSIRKGKRISENGLDWAPDLEQ
jgi:hypothetical protein